MSHVIINTDEASKVSILSGHGTEDDENDIDANETKQTSKQTNKTGDLCIEIKLGKDNDKSKTLLAGTAFRAAVTGATGAKSNTAGKNLNFPPIFDRNIITSIHAT